MLSHLVFFSLSHSIEKRVYLTILRLLISLLKQKGKIKTQEEEEEEEVEEEAGTGSNLIPFDYYQGAIITALLGSGFFVFLFISRRLDFLLLEERKEKKKVLKLGLKKEIRIEKQLQ